MPDILKPACHQFIILWSDTKPGWLPENQKGLRCTIHHRPTMIGEIPSCSTLTSKRLQTVVRSARRVGRRQWPEKRCNDKCHQGEGKELNCSSLHRKTSLSIIVDSLKILNNNNQIKNAST